jgi:hypothetical protein
MPQNLSAEVSECLVRAQYYAERAKSEADSTIQGDFVEMERCWLQMASSYRALAWLQSSPRHVGQCDQLSDRLDRLKRELARGHRQAGVGRNDGAGIS